MVVETVVEVVVDVVSMHALHVTGQVRDIDCSVPQR